MKRKEWVILAVLIAGVAALEVFSTGGDVSTEHDIAPEHALPDSGIRTDTRSADQAALPDTSADPLAAFRTVRLHVTGMT